MYFSQVTVHSVDQLGIWLGVRSRERRRIEWTPHENIPISTRLNESLPSAKTKRNVPLQSNTEKQMKIKNGGVMQNKKYIFINQTMSHMQLFSRITTKICENNKGTTSKNFMSFTVMFRNYHSITASVSKMCETFTYVVRSHSTAWLTCCDIST